MGFFRFASFDVERSVTSNLYGPKVLLFTRLVGLFYLVAVIMGALATTPSLHYFISFFTNISFCALTIYYLWSLIWSIQYCRLAPSQRELWAERQNRFVGVYWVIYGSLATFHIVIPLIFWTLLRPRQKPHTGVYEWATISEHSADGVLMILEVILTRMVMEIRHMPFTLLFMLLYLLSAFVNFWTTHWWVYSFLDYEVQGWKVTGLFYVGIAAVLVLIYGIMWKIHAWKESLATRHQSNTDRKQTIKGQECGDESEGIHRMELEDKKEPVPGVQLQAVLIQK